MKYSVNIDLQQNELQNAVFQPLSGAPSSPKNAQIYYDTTLVAFRIYMAGGWHNALDDTWLDTDPTLAGNLDTKLATQKAVKTYVDNAVQGLSWKQQVRAASTTNGPGELTVRPDCGLVLLQPGLQSTVRDGLGRQVRAPS